MSLCFAFLASVGACEEDGTAPVQYGAVHGNVSVEYLEKSPDNISGDTVSVLDIDSLEVLVDGEGSVEYTVGGGFSVPRVRYGSRSIVARVIPDLEAESGRFTLERDDYVLPDTITFTHKLDLHPELIEAGYTIPNPFSNNNQTGILVKQDMTLDILVYSPSGMVVRHLFLREVRDGSMAFTWDARNDLMIRCAPGLYFIVFYGDGILCSYITTVLE